MQPSRAAPVGLQEARVERLGQEGTAGLAQGLQGNEGSLDVSGQASVSGQNMEWGRGWQISVSSWS